MGETENCIRENDEKSARCGIVVKKELECGIRLPPPRPCRMVSWLTGLRIVQPPVMDVVSGICSHYCYKLRTLTCTNVPSHVPPFLIVYFIFYRINKEITVVGRNPSSSDIFLDSNKNKVMISRLHARIISEKDATGKHTFKISDTSLNGTYINDIKISDSCDLNPGDTVTFGHLKGAVLPPGVVAQQPDSEFRFKVSSLFEYSHFKLRVHSHGIR